MNSPNDTVLTRESQKIDLIKCPTINENKKDDTGHHQKRIIKLERLTPDELYKIDRRRFSKSYIMTYCPHCGHHHPISRYELSRLRREHYKQWSHRMNYKLSYLQRKLRAQKAGTQRAINAGQKLRSKTNVQEGILNGS